MDDKKALKSLREILLQCRRLKSGSRVSVTETITVKRIELQAQNVINLIKGIDPYEEEPPDDTEY